MNLEQKEVIENRKKVMLNYFTNKGNNSIPELVSEPGRKRWIEWGVMDTMPYRLFELYNQSGFHHAIIESRVNMIVGAGIAQKDTEIISQRTDNFIKSPNNDETMYNLSKKLAYDYEIFGLAYIEVIFSQDRTKISQINHIDATKIRWGHKNLNKLTHFFYSDDWRKPNKYKPILIPKFNPRIKEEHPRQILPIIKYTPSVDYYTLPSYYAAIKWISIDYEISNYHEKNIKNGFAPTIYFGFPHGVPTEDERQEIEKKLKQKYGGTDNAGGIITAFYESGADNKVDVQILAVTDADQQYEWLSSHTQQEILIGHKVTNENLVGISTPGKLGSSNEILQSHEMYYNDVIKHEQNDIIEQLNKLMAYNGMNDLIFLNDTPLAQQFGTDTLEKVLTQDEMREVVGYEPLEITEEVVDETVLHKIHKHKHNHKFEPDDEEVIGEVGKEVDCGDIIEFNGKKHTLSQTVIDSKTGISADANDKDLYTWTLGPGGLSKENCPICMSYAGQIRALRRWKRTAIPGTKENAAQGIKYKYGDYGTYCENHCTCKLIKVS